MRGIFRNHVGKGPVMLALDNPKFLSFFCVQSHSGNPFIILLELRSAFINWNRGFHSRETMNVGLLLEKVNKYFNNESFAK
ncbi:hypothetical protein Tco_0433920, partial [Tanacetum coccineum]